MRLRLFWIRFRTYRFRPWFGLLSLRMLKTTLLNAARAGAKEVLRFFNKDFGITYSLHKKENGVYAFVIEGDVTINGEKLNRRDGLGITETDKLEIKADSDSELLLMELPV